MPLGRPCSPSAEVPRRVRDNPRMRIHPTLAGAAAVLLLTGALSACTSDPPPDPEVEEDTLEGSIPSSGWWCRFINRTLVDQASGEQSDVAREVLRKNDFDGWQCEVVLPVEGGPRTEEVYTLSILVNDYDLVQEWRARAEEAGAEPGPQHLGESYVWPGTAVALIPCQGQVGGPYAGQDIPHVFSLEAYLEPGLEMTTELTTPVTHLVRDLDALAGCAPSRQIEVPDDSEQGNSDQDGSDEDDAEQTG